MMENVLKQNEKKNKMNKDEVFWNKDNLSSLTVIKSQ